MIFFTEITNNTILYHNNKGKRKEKERKKREKREKKKEKKEKKDHKFIGTC